MKEFELTADVDMRRIKRMNVISKILNNPGTRKMIKVYRQKKIEREGRKTFTSNMQTEESETHIVECEHDVLDLVESALDDGATNISIDETKGWSVEDTKNGKWRVRFHKKV